VVGFQPLATGTVEHESALERDFVTLTSFLDADASIVSQPITLTYRDGAKTRRYTPDFLVRSSHRRTELVEVKYRADLRANWSRLKPGFIAARVWARERDATFRIATERRIRGLRLENAKRLLPLRHAPLDAEIAEHALAAARTLRAPSVGGILALLPTDRSRSLATLWCLIARGALRIDLSQRIGVDTQVLPS
jgi:hypothetical protein